MKAVILAGGLGSRLSEETDVKPKPMVEIGGKPIIWHILKIFSTYGVNDFIICCGYKGYVIKEYFANYSIHVSDISVNLLDNSICVHDDTKVEPWNVTLIDTGDLTMTGGRLKRVSKYLNKGEDFFFTYGDGVSDINIKQLLSHHRRYGRLATVTAVRPPGRFGNIVFGSDNAVLRFEEKREPEKSWISGGFFVLNPKVIDRISGDTCVWEDQPMSSLAIDNQLTAYFHTGFWHPMDTLRDRRHLESLWTNNAAPWRIWGND